jgi:hypothetical protein
MKKGFLVLTAIGLFIGGALAVSAQDLIILRDGSVIEAKVTEIAPSEIRYKRANHLDGPTIVVPVATVLSIRYANGKVDQFNAAPSAPAGAPAPAAARPGAPAPAAGTNAGNTPLPGAVQTASAIAGAAGLPGGDITSLQDALNRIPAIPVAGKNLKFIFLGETWRAQVNGADTLDGTLTFQASETGGIITLKPVNAYLRGRQIPAPSASILLEYTAGPPMSLRSLSKKEQQAFAQQQAAAAPAAGPISTQPGPDNAILWQDNGHKYLVVDQSMSWDKANAYAAEQGGYLATITSKEKQAFIEDLLAAHGKSNNYWLGGNRVGKNWQWTSGEPWGYTNWMRDEPNNANGKENKLMLARVAPPGKGSANGKWNDSINDANKTTGWGSYGLIIEWNE